MAYRTIGIEPTGGALGAEVRGVDLGRPLEAATVAEIRAALLAHQVIFFRDQTMTPDQQEAVCRRFGELDVHPFSEPLAGHPKILEVVKEPDDEENFGGGWHSDMSYNEVPPMATFLYAREVPPVGGDTLFADTYAAYDGLEPATKRRIDGLVALHGPAKVYGRRGLYREGGQSTRVSIKGDPERTVEHPLVRTHPETGRKALYVDAPHIIRFKGLDEAAGEALLAELYAHATRDEYVYRFAWRKDSVALWDNRCTLHYALNDYHGQRRVMHRIVIAASAPPA